MEAKRKKSQDFIKEIFDHGHSDITNSYPIVTVEYQGPVTALIGIDILYNFAAFLGKKSLWNIY